MILLKRKTLIFLLSIIITGLILRFWKINIPLLEFQPSRQVQTSEITKNIFYTNFNTLLPKVTYLGPGYVPYILEFPGFNIVVAYIYMLTGNIHEVYGRYFSILGWILGAFFLYRIARVFLDERHALIALFFYTFSPISVLVSRSFQPDQWMLTLSLASIYSFILFQSSKRFGLFALSAFFASISSLLKITSLVFTVFPILLFILFFAKGKKVIQLFLYAVTSGTFPVAWYVYAFIINHQGLALEENFVFSNWFKPTLFLKYKYYGNVFGDEYTLVILPTGFLLLLIGLFVFKKDLQRFLYFWLFGLFVYFLIFNNPVMVHEYYHIPFLPLASIFIAIGFWVIVDVFYEHKRFVTIFLISLILINCIPQILLKTYKPIERFRLVPYVGERIQQLTNKSDLIIGSMDAGPTLVYYSKRNGWGFDSRGPNNPSTVPSDYNTTEKLEQLRIKGASVFASSYKKQFLDNLEFSQYMYSTYKPLEDNDYYVIFDLKEKKIN